MGSVRERGGWRIVGGTWDKKDSVTYSFHDIDDQRSSPRDIAVLHSGHRYGNSWMTTTWRSLYRFFSSYLWPSSCPGLKPSFLSSRYYEYRLCDYCISVCLLLECVMTAIKGGFSSSVSATVRNNTPSIRCPCVCWKKSADVCPPTFSTSGCITSFKALLIVSKYQQGWWGIRRRGLLHLLP